MYGNINLQWIYVIRKDAYYLIDTDAYEFSLGPLNKEKAAMIGDINGIPFNADSVKVFP